MLGAACKERTSNHVNSTALRQGVISMSHHLVNQLIHTMWSTKDQKYAIPLALKEHLYAYINSLMKIKNGHVIALGGSSDHIHLLTLLPPDISISMLLSHVKACSSRWIKLHGNLDPQFSWQTGYLAVSTQEDKLDGVCTYIKSDEARHQSKSYREELIGMLKLQNIAYNEAYFLQNSFSKILVHAVWSTNDRAPMLKNEIRQDLYAHIKDVIANNKGTTHAIGGIDDHVHVLMEIPKDKALSEMIQTIKSSATHWLKIMDHSKFHDFEWQTGFGAGTVSYSIIEIIKNYIHSQEKHHRSLSYNDEWGNFVVNKGILTLAYE